MKKVKETPVEPSTELDTTPVPKFKVGDIVIHKLFGDKSVVTDVYFEKERGCYVCAVRMKNYMLIDLNEFELLPYAKAKRGAKGVVRNTTGGGNKPVKKRNR